MDGGTRVVGLRRDQEPAEMPEQWQAAVTLDADEDAGDTSPRDTRFIAATVLAIIAALGWLVLAAGPIAPRWLQVAPSLQEVAATIGFVSPPLLLVGMIWAFVARGSRGQLSRYATTAAALRSEQHRLQASLAITSARLDEERTALAEANEQLLALGEEAGHRLKGVGEAMRTEVEAITRHAGALKASATAARADVAVLLADLPKAQVQTRDMATALDAAGVTAHSHVGALDALLASLTSRGREADEIAGGAASKLAAHLARIEGVSGTAGASLENAAATMTQAVDAALDRAAAATDAARQNMDAQGSAMLALVDQSQAALQRTGADAAEAIAARIGETNELLQAAGALLAAQSEQTDALLARLKTGLADLDTHFTALDEGGAAKSERLGLAFANLRDDTKMLTGALEHGNANADVLIARTETLMTALDATARELDDRLPAAFAALDERTAASRALIDSASPEIARMSVDAAATLDRLIEAEAILAKQGAALDSGSEAAARFVATVEEADAKTRALADGTGATLVEAMVRVRETANQAAERALEAIERVIPESAERLSQASRDALTRAVTEQVETQIASLAATAEGALDTAHKASDRLMRQMLTIADTSAAVEARIAEARADAETADRDNFARRVALLIESLNSTAIDVTKVLSNEVTDSAWAAYLRGDRGVFTRRAVRLLDGAEVREVTRHYDGDHEFREQVNRYVHDFEAMLRNTLATRDGAALSVTLLSSDMGKLYVALAQAIERLRT